MIVKDLAITKEQRNIGNVIDFTHHLYLHPSDTQAVLLVPHILTGPKNYAIWSRSMRIALLRKNKIGFIDGSYMKESQDASLRP